jgi:hypothetical protein
VAVSEAVLPGVRVVDHRAAKVAALHDEKAAAHRGATAEDSVTAETADIDRDDSTARVTGVRGPMVGTVRTEPWAPQMFSRS